MLIFPLNRVVQHLLRKVLTPLSPLGFIFYTEVIGGLFQGLEKNKGSRSLEILLYVYIDFLLVLPKLYMLIKSWCLYRKLLY